MQEQRTCGCGCGELANPGRRFVYGHNGRRTPEAWRVDPETGCWVWCRRIQPDGYGWARRGRRTMPAHRAVWEDKFGPLPPDVELHHRCENRACVNIDHLEPVHETKHGLLHARLTPDDVRAIRDAPKGYGTGRKLAAQFGVCEAYISAIRGRHARLDVL